MKLRCWSCEKALGLRFVLVSGSDVIKHVDHCYLACVTCAGQQQEGTKAYVSREPERTKAPFRALRTRI